jgi:hypothetical protein
VHGYSSPATCSCRSDVRYSRRNGSGSRSRRTSAQPARLSGSDRPAPADRPRTGRRLATMRRRLRRSRGVLLSARPRRGYGDGRGDARCVDTYVRVGHPIVVVAKRIELCIDVPVPVHPKVDFDPWPVLPGTWGANPVNEYGPLVDCCGQRRRIPGCAGRCGALVIGDLHNHYPLLLVPEAHAALLSSRRPREGGGANSTSCRRARLGCPAGSRTTRSLAAAGQAVSGAGRVATNAR